MISHFLIVKTAIFKIDFIKMFVKLVTSFKGEPNTSWIFFETWRSLILLQDHSFVADDSWIHVMLTVSSNPFFLLDHQQSSGTRYQNAGR